MQYLYIAIFLLPRIFSGVGKIKIPQSVKLVFILVIGYMVWNWFRNREEQQSAEKTALTDPAGNMAVRLFDALHPFFKTKNPIIGYLPDGTNETAAFAIAAEIKKANNWLKVQDYYKKMYGISLTDDLASEGIVEEFSNILTGITTPKTVSVPVKQTAPNWRNNKGLLIEKGKRYVIDGVFYLRDPKNTNTVLGKTSTGDVYHVNSLVTYSLEGKTVKGANVSKVVLGTSWGILTDRIISLDAFKKLA